MRVSSQTLDVSRRPRPVVSALMWRWCRRILSISAYGTVLILLVAMFPLWFAFAFATDGVLRRKFATVRLLAFLLFFLAMELAGTAAAFALWCLHRLIFVIDRTVYLRWNFRLQCWWGSTLARVGLRIFGMRLDVDDGYAFSDRPIILFLRHTSFADTVIAVLLVSARHSIRLRYVLKRQLLWDPCLDIVGHRLQNHFVRRGDISNDEAAAVGRLAQKLGPREGVLIYPEGTRFTEQKRTNILASLHKHANTQIHDRAASYTNVLPPRMGGTLALLSANTDADAVFCAHTGLEGSATLRDVLNGAIIGNTVRVKFWGVPFDAIPRTPAKRKDWFDDQWQQVDAWVGRHR